MKLTERLNHTVSQEIQTGEREIVLCGGTESMSQAGFIVRDVRFGTKLGGDYKVMHTVN
jgi:acetyl-CoA acyltransferase 2